MAGLTAMYDAGTHYYLFVSYDETQGKCLNLFACDHEQLEWPKAEPVNINGWKRIYLRASIDYEKLQFAYSADGDTWTDIGPMLDADKLSDEYANGFTGAFFGLCAQDANRSSYADFDWFEYIEDHLRNNL
jgi:xylan 1,4-beta-xylosidase